MELADIQVDMVKLNDFLERWMVAKSARDEVGMGEQLKK